MNKLLLAPYNNAMHTGDGYNSFQHTACLGKVVQATAPGPTSPTGALQPSMPQVVSYNSRQVKHLSGLVQSMNISPASVIQLGSLKLLGHFTPVNEAAFNDSDLNIVVSVSVSKAYSYISVFLSALKLTDWSIQENNKPKESFKFSPPAQGQLPTTTKTAMSSKFTELYGDSYISGFVEGGEFLGIVSVKVIDDTKKDAILQTFSSIVGLIKILNNNSLKGKINSTSSDSSSDGKPVDFNSILKHTETAITVNWSGGGQIKPPNEQWSLNSLFQVAARFPVKVAEHPTRTWAILAPYHENKSFVEWADECGVELPQFNILHRYTTDLLHIYLDYKSHLALLQDVLSSPRDYTQCTSSKPVAITTEQLLEARTEIKAEMEKIVDVVNLLGRNPTCGKTYITPPELWAARLPVLKNAAFRQQITLLTDVDQPGGQIVPRGAPRTGTFEAGLHNQLIVRCGPGFPAKSDDLLVGMTYLECSTSLTSANIQIVRTVENGHYNFRLEVGHRNSGLATCMYLNPALCGPGFQWGGISPQTRTTINNIRFRNRFTNKPHVVAWISGLDLGYESKSMAKVCASRVTTTGFTLEADGWTVRQCPNQQVTWVAIPQSPSIKTGTIQFGKGHPQDSDIAFSNDSEVFMAVNMFCSSKPKLCFNVMPKCRGEDEWCVTSDAGVSDEDTVGVSYIIFSALDE